MSNRELCASLLDSFTDSQLANVATMLQAMKQAIEDAFNPAPDIPNAETIAALMEGDEMLRAGAGQHFKGSAAEFFAMLDEEDDDA